MKILIATAVYYPMINGVATFSHNLALGLAKRGHEVMVICPSFTGKKHTKMEDGVRVNYLKSIRIAIYPDQINTVPPKKKFFKREMPQIFYKHGLWASVAPGPEIKKIIKRFQPDVIHSQTADPIALWTAYLAKRFKIPLITTGHTYPDTITDQIKFLKPIKKPIDAMLSAFLVEYQKHGDYATMPTEMAIDDLITKKRKKFRIPVEAISNGVDLTAFKPGRASVSLYKELGMPEKRPIALYVGRVDPEKSVSLVVEAFSQVLEKIPQAVLVIVGDGTDVGNLRELVKKLGIEQSVRFLGRILSPKLEQVYRLGNVFVTASEIETQGIVLIEAAATGLPLIAVDKGAVREVCQNGKNGILLQPKDVAGIAKGLVEILGDKKLQQKYSEESLKIAKTHDINHTLERFENIYQKMIQNKTR